MSASLLRPQGRTLYASATKAATFTGATIEVPLAESYTFILDVTAASGTTETLDVAIQVTVDGGTTWYTAARFAQVTTAAVIRRLQIQSVMGRGEAGSEAAIANTGGALASNTAITKKIRHVATIGGTNPSYTYVIYMIAVTKGNSSD